MTEEERKAYRERMFNEGKEQMKQESENQNSGSYSYGDYEEITGCALSPQGSALFRIIGGIPTKREFGSDPKKVFVARVLGDNEKMFRLVYPDKSQTGHLFWRIYNKVMERKWSDGVNEKGQKISKATYVNEKAFPNIFNRVRCNNVFDSKYEKGWSPRELILMNVIDRLDPQWHKENKHTKLLCRGMSVKNDGSIWYDEGIPYAAYRNIWDDAVEFYGDWEEYDIVMRKFDKDPWYQAFSCKDNVQKISKLVSMDYVVDGPLTPEERSYGMYDFDALYPVTSYMKFRNRLGGFIELIDKNMGTHYKEELDEFADEEKAEFDRKEKENAPKVAVESNPIKANKEESVPVTAEPPKEVEQPKQDIQSVPVRPVRQAVKQGIDWEGLANGTYNGTKYLGVPKLTEEEKALVLGVNEKGEFIYDPKAGQLYADCQSGFQSPGAFHCDPLSGNEF